MEANKAVKYCATCPLCKFTRNRKKEDIFYNIARRIQNTCPNCKEANEASGNDLQKSRYIVQMEELFK